MVIVKYVTESVLPDNFTGFDYYYDNNDHEFIKTFRKNNKVHRYFGPAMISGNGHKEWWFNDTYHASRFKKYNQKEFIKDLSKRWLL